MINLSASGGSVTFSFSGNSGYLQDGTISVPVNSLSLVIDESNMATFRKPNNDVFLSALVSEFGMTKNELIAWYKANMTYNERTYETKLKEVIDRSVTSIDIPSGVTNIGDYSFAYCRSLTSCTIGSGVTSIGNNAFYFCTNLTSINIPDIVTSIGSAAFGNCSNLPVENNIKYADTYAVEATDKTLSTYTIKSGTRFIGDSVFNNCKSLTSIVIPDSVISINSQAFFNCTSLTSVTIGSGVTSIGNSAFRNCFGLTSISIPDSVTSIGASTFQSCSGLTSINIPDSVTSIDDRAFYDCSGLTSCTIGSGVTSIGNYAFNGCSGLTSITMEATTPPTITNSTFSNTNDCPIYVPKGCGYTYAIAWQSYPATAMRIQEIPEENNE